MKKICIFLLLIGMHMIDADMYQYHLSDRWYPSTKKKLKQILGLFDQPSDQYKFFDFSGKKIVAMVVPHAAYQYCGSLAAHVFKHISLNMFDRVIILAACSNRTFRGVALPGATYTSYKTPLGIIDLDCRVLKELAQQSSLFFDQHEIHEMEHAIEVQIPFIQKYCGHCKIVPLIVGDLNEIEMDQVCAVLKKSVHDKTLILVSSDLVQSSYENTDASFIISLTAQQFAIDNLLLEKFQNQDFVGFEQMLSEKKLIVRGKNPLLMLLNMMHNKYIDVHDCVVLGYECCHTQQINMQNCVGYVGMIMLG